jgi:hypothetical protein
MVVARDWEKGRMQSYCLMGMECHLGKMRKCWRRRWWQLHNNMNVLTPQSCALKNVFCYVYFATIKIVNINSHPDNSYLCDEERRYSWCIYDFSGVLIFSYLSSKIHTHSFYCCFKTVLCVCVYVCGGGTGVWTHSLYLDSLYQHFFVMGFFKTGSQELFAQLASNLNPPDRYLLSR